MSVSPYESPDNGEELPQRRIRASDADRDELLKILGAAHAHGRLDHEEIDERQSAVLRCRYLHELPPLVDDLPEGGELVTRISRQVGLPQSGPGTTAPVVRHATGSAPAPVEPGSAPPTTSVAVMSGRELHVSPGTGVVNAYALMGGDNIDLCEVMGPGVVVTLKLYSMWGGHEIFVPPGVKVVDEVINIMAGNSVRRSARGDGSNGTVVLKGFSLMAGSEVRLAPGSGRNPELPSS